MKKLYVFSLLVLLATFLQSFPCQAMQDYFEDTVWVKNTNQMDGFYMVKFSNNDSIIVAHGYSQDHFYETKTGNLIVKINGNREVFFINNDKQFIKLRQDQKVFEIIDNKSFKVIDSLENDTLGISYYTAISNNKKYLVSSVTNGIRIWSIETKKILLTKYIKPEENLISWGTGHITFNCDDSQIIAAITKKYYDPSNPYEPLYKGGLYAYDFKNLDSLYELPSRGDFKLSNKCKYVAYKTSNNDYGLEIYELETKKLIQKLPIDGISITGMEFSPDDKYVVTSNGPDGNSLIVWNTVSGEKAYSYFYGSYSNIDVSNNGKYIVSSTGKYLFLWNFKNETSIVENEVENNLKNIYPNPTNSIATIEFKLKNTGITKIELTNTQGDILKTILNKLLEAGIQKFEFKTDEIPSGTYFVVIQSEQEKIVFQLIVNH